MTEWIWLNGQVLPLGEARISVEDRGFQFADGIYEVIRLYSGRPFAMRPHLERLKRSAAGIMLPLPMGLEELSSEIEKLIARSEVAEGMVYLQLTRGASPRNHAFPDVLPTLLFYVRQLPPIPAPGTAPGVKLLSVPDERWQRCYIKSIALLPNVLAKNTALAAGADEAVFIHDGVVTECSASNFFAIRGGKLFGHPAGPKVLPGITSLVLLQVARQMGVEVIERPLREAEAVGADELFITSTTREIGWVSHWNDRTVAPGKCGPVTLKLHRGLQERVAKETT